MFVTLTRYSSCPPGSAIPPPTTKTCFVIRSCCATPTTTTVGWKPFPDTALVADECAGRGASVHLDVKGHDGAAARRQRAHRNTRAGTGDGNRQHRPGRTGYRATVQRRRTREVGRVHGNRVGQDDRGRRRRRRVRDGNGVAQHVERIDDTCVTVVDLDLHGLEAVHEWQVPDDVTGGIVKDGRLRIVRWFLRKRAAPRTAARDESLVRNDCAVGNIRRDDNVEGDRGDVRSYTARVCAHRARRCILGRIDQLPVLQRRHPRRRIRERRAVERRAVRDVRRIRRYLIAQRHVNGVFVPDILNRDCVTQRFTGAQHVRIAAQVR